MQVNKKTTEYRIKHDNGGEEIEVIVFEDTGKLTINPQGSKEDAFRFWGSDPDRVERIGEMLIQAAQLGKDAKKINITL